MKWVALIASSGEVQLEATAYVNISSLHLSETDRHHANASWNTAGVSLHAYQRILTSRHFRTTVGLQKILVALQDLLDKSVGSANHDYLCLFLESFRVGRVRCS